MQTKYLVAVSGGVDSIVLAHYLLTNNYQFAILHVNHQTRYHENQFEYNLVSSFAESNQIDLYYYKYEHKSGNFQSMAREFRLQKAKNIIEDNHLKGLILGHHFDDQLENILMSQEKISPCLMHKHKLINNINVYRPMLKIPKSKLYKYAKKNQLLYNEDYTNESTKYQRNKHRIELKNYSEIEKQELYDRQIKKEIHYNQIICQEIMIENFKKKNYLDQQIMLIKLIRSKIFKIDIKKQLLNDIIRSVSSLGYKEFYLSPKFKVIKGYKQIYIFEDKPIINQMSLKFGVNDFNGITFYNKDYTGTIRTFKPGDKVKIRNYHKKVSRLFIDLKVEKNQRNRWPIIINQKNEIVSIPKIWEDL